MPYTALFEDDSESASGQQLRSLSLHTESAVTGDQRYTALGPPPCPSSPEAVDKASQWDIASYASNLPSHLHMCAGLQSPAPSEQSCYSQRLTEYSFNASGPGSPTQQHTSYIGPGVPSNHSAWLNSQPDSRDFRQQPVSSQLGPPAQPQDKLLLTPLLYTTTAALQSQVTTILHATPKAAELHVDSVPTVNNNFCTAILSSS